MMALPGCMCVTAALGQIEHRVNIGLKSELPFLADLRDIP